MRTFIFSLFVALLFLTPAVMMAQEPFEFSGQSRKKPPTLSKEQTDAYTLMGQVVNLLGDGKKPKDAEKAVEKLSQIIKMHPEYSDAYLLRASVNLQFKTSNNYQQIIDDINNAIKFQESKVYKSMYENNAARFSMRAKAEKLMGNYQLATDDFEKAIRLSAADPNDIVIVSGTKAEDASATDLWTKADFDEFISRFPTDYRTYLFRGYFYSFFVAFDEKRYSSLAVADYEKAIALDSSSALCFFMIGKLYEKSSFWNQKVWSDLSGQTKADYQRKVVQELTKAIQLDPQLKEAYISRAEAYYILQEYGLAITDYNKIIELDPNDGFAYNDRGLAHFNLGDYYFAIDDYDSAVEKKDSKEEGFNFSYQNRADAYMKVKDYSKAIQDYGRAIQSELGKVIVIMNLPQIRRIYREYKSLSDAALTKKLWDKLSPNLKYKDFAEMLLKNKGKNFSDTVIPELYLSRGDAYLNYGEFRNAIREYQRAIDGFPDYHDAIDKWRLFAVGSLSKQYLDAMDVSIRSMEVRFWTKEVFDETQNNNIAYSIKHWTVRRSPRLIKMDSQIDYDSDGNVINSWSGSDWQTIVPDSFGEMLYKGWWAQ